MFQVSAQLSLSTASKPTLLRRLSFSKRNILKRAPLSNLLSRPAARLLSLLSAQFSAKPTRFAPGQLSLLSANQNKQTIVILSCLQKNCQTP